MKTWERYRELLPYGDWHVHSNYVDGKSSIDEMCRQALNNGLRLVAFTEHVRKELTYNYDDFIKEIKEARQKYPELKILYGCEAKILEGGELDASRDVLDKCEFVVAVFHTLPYQSKEDNINALREALSNPRVESWGHPGTLLNKYDFEPEEMEELVRLCIRNNVLIENNLKEKYTPPQEFSRIVEKLGAATVFGSDAHHTSELRKLSK